jgi:hypothetical protein
VDGADDSDLHVPRSVFLPVEDTIVIAEVVVEVLQGLFEELADPNAPVLLLPDLLMR